MKLAFCLFRYFPYGGLERDALALMQACAQRGAEVHVYTTAWTGELPEFLHVHTLTVQGWTNHSRLENFAREVQMQLSSSNDDRVIGFQKMPGLDIYYAADVCFVARHAAWWQHLLPRYRVYRRLEEAVFSVNSKTHILCLAQKTKQEYQRWYQTPETRWTLLPPGISKAHQRPEDFQAIRQQMREQYQATDHTVVWLMIASRFRTKGVDRALELLAALPTMLRNQVHLWIIGEDHVASYQQQCRQLELESQVRFLGAQARVSPFLWSADILVHPARVENTGTVLLEAVVAGLPVVTTDLCGYAEQILEAQAGIVLPEPFSVAAWLPALELLASPSIRAAYRQNGLIYSSQADWYSLISHATDVIFTGEHDSLRVLSGDESS